MREPGQQLTQSAGGLELCGQSPQEVQELMGHCSVSCCAGASFTDGVSTNLVLPSWNGGDASEISWEGWKAAPVPCALSPLAPGGPE